MDNIRQRIPEDHPVNTIFRDTDKRRAEAEIDDIFDFSGQLSRDDVSVSHGGKGAAVIEPEGYLDDPVFESFTEQAKESEKLGWDPMGKENYVKPSTLRTPKPLDVHTDRSEEAINQDIQRKAPVTTDPQKYAENPDEYDYPFVDTPSEFKDEFGDKINPFNRFERMAGEDDVFRY